MMLLCEGWATEGMGGGLVLGLHAEQVRLHAEWVGLSAEWVKLLTEWVGLHVEWVGLNTKRMWAQDNVVALFHALHYQFSINCLQCLLYPAHRGCAEYNNMLYNRHSPASCC